MRLIDKDKLIEKIAQSIINDYNTGDNKKDEVAQGALAYARTLVESAPEVTAESKHGIVEDAGFIRFDDESFVDLDPCEDCNYAFDLRRNCGVTVFVVKDYDVPR
jgi:hypothetical protein